MENCNTIQEKLVDYIDKNLSNQHLKLVKKHLSSCKNCHKEFMQKQKIQTIISSEAEDVPSEKLRLNFNKIIEKEKVSITLEKNVIQLSTNYDWKQFLRIAASIVVVLSAFLIGKYQANLPTQIVNITSEKEENILAMISSDSASKRIQAIDLSEEITKPAPKIIEALVSRLFNDKNTNVRLASAEALSNFSSSETVKNALIKALETDNEPTVQIELIQILTKIQEKRALEPMRKLLKKEETPTFLKQQLALNIANLT